MKTSAIVRIVLLSLAILVLLGILGSVLLARNFYIDVRDSGVIDVVNEVLTIKESGDIQIDGTGYSGEYDASNIRDLKIEWVAGTIVIQPGDTDTILFEETAVSNSKYKMVSKLTGDKLTLTFCDESVLDWSVGDKINSNISKDLVITVPRNWMCDALEIDTASARVEVYDLKLNELDFDGASGKMYLDNCEIVELDIDTASGDVEFSGILKTLDFDAASAKFYGEFYQMPNNLKLDAMSGDAELVLPSYAGFEMVFDSLSGSFESDFQFTTSGNSYKCGDCACKITVKTMSGDVSILKGVSNPQYAAGTECIDPNCTDPSHDHSEICNDKDCTDASHGHNNHH